MEYDAAKHRAVRDAAALVSAEIHREMPEALWMDMAAELSPEAWQQWARQVTGVHLGIIRALLVDLHGSPEAAAEAWRARMIEHGADSEELRRQFPELDPGAGNR